MNKTAIKNFAVWARTKLRDDIKIRAGFLGINEDGIATPLPASTQEIKYFEVGSAQPIELSGEKLRGRERIVEKLQKKAKETDYKTAYDLMVETYASDWFNRFVAIRFMEVNERFSDNMRVLSSSNPDRHDPDIVSQPFSSDLEFTDKERADITEWKTKNETDKLFRFLLIKRCNELSKILPGLFEKEGDESELMMRQSFIDKDGVIYHLVNDIDEEDWKDQVQIIGWIYQYYNSELKDETFALTKKGKKISKERVPSATQLFTPDWIVRYMVENSLGRIWVEGHSAGDWSEDTEKKAADDFGWKYYLPEAKQEADVAEQLKTNRAEYSKLNPEDLTFIDPSMGSGHILVYAFDVLMQIYESLGYTRRDAARSIVENNIYGLDIDDRAYQLAYFAVMMKACEYDGRFLERGVRPHVYSIQESNDVNRNQLKFFGADLSDIEKNNAMNQVIGLLDTFIDAKEYGSILNVENYDWKLLRRFAEVTDDNGQMSLETIGIVDTQKKLLSLIELGEVMTKKYCVTCTNPPYMGLSNANPKLNTYITKQYKEGKSDVYAAFIMKCLDLTKRNMYTAMITQQSWMFLSSFEKLRGLIYQYTISNLLQIGFNTFPELNSKVALGASFVIRKNEIKNYKGTYYDLTRVYSKSADKEKIFEQSILEHKEYVSIVEKYKDIPGKPVAFWASDEIRKAFENGIPLGNVGFPCQGMATTNNDKFLRLWFEVNLSNINFSAVSEDDTHDCKWYPYNKGGDFRKWYGNNFYIINFKNKGREVCDYIDSHSSVNHTGRVINRDKYFKPNFTWSALALELSCRYSPNGFIFDTKGSSCFIEDIKLLKYCMAIMNSSTAKAILEILAPTLDFNCGTIAKVPIIIDNSYFETVIDIVDENIELSKEDWNSEETAWDFKKLSFVNDSTSVKEAIDCCIKEHAEISEKIRENEEELNRIISEIYKVSETVNDSVLPQNIALRSYDVTKMVKDLISYSVGCMLGRYSLSAEGLAYAGGEWDDSKYRGFLPDVDNVIPITDARYMDDDIVDRFCEWLSVVYGEDSLEDNLTFIANALGTKGTDSRDIIRNYFLNDFFKDHCQTYSVTGSGKRPIYWLFDSGKQNGFKALIYMHRYNADTIGRVRVAYLHPLQEKYENEVRSIDTMISHMTDQRQISKEEKRREKLIKQIAEVKEYDERLDHLAQEHIDIDLDDGVKVNYEKVQTDRDGKKYHILAPIK